MKLKKLAAISLLTIAALTAPRTVNCGVKSIPYKIRCTTYYANEGDITTDGSKVHEGIVAGKKEWLGKTAVLYEITEEGSIGNVIGVYEFRDTGYGIDVPGSKYGTIQLGKSIDVYRNNLPRCHDWVNTYGDYVYIQIIEAEG